MSSHCFSPAHHLWVSQEAGGRLCAGATAHSAPTREQMLEGTLDLERSASVCLPAPLRGLRRILGPFPPRAQEGPWQEGILPVGPPCRAVGPQVGGGGRGSSGLPPEPRTEAGGTPRRRC